eukprot:484546-Rhodomonas_salina.1
MWMTAYGSATASERESERENTDFCPGLPSFLLRRPPIPRMQALSLLADAFPSDRVATATSIYTSELGHLSTALSTQSAASVIYTTFQHPYYVPSVFPPRQKPPVYAIVVPLQARVFRGRSRISLYARQLPSWYPASFRFIPSRFPIPTKRLLGSCQHRLLSPNFAGGSGTKILGSRRHAFRIAVSGSRNCSPVTALVRVLVDAMSPPSKRAY